MLTEAEKTLTACPHCPGNIAAMSPPKIMEYKHTFDLTTSYQAACSTCGIAAARGDSTEEAARNWNCLIGNSRLSNPDMRGALENLLKTQQNPAATSEMIRAAQDRGRNALGQHRCFGEAKP